MSLRKAAIFTAIIWISGLQLDIAGAQTVIYVNVDAPASGDGLSWDTAYDSLDTALTAAEPGNQIWVAAGTYVGNFTLALEVELYGGFAGTETELGQRNWTVNRTILDANQRLSVVTSPPGATETTRIDGFTITNGLTSFGGGLFLDHSSPTIANNTITGNSAYIDGGGLYVYYSSPMIANNTITGNNTMELGGGLYMSESSPRIVDNTIMGNTTGQKGGGLYMTNSSPTLANNTITGNTADDAGGGLRLYFSSPTISNNTITGNNARYGGGLALRDSSPTITDNTITGNSASNGGGGLYLYSDSSPTIANNTITGNSASGGGGLFLSRSSPTIADNTITGNGATDDGGGLSLYASSPTIANTIVAYNSSGIHQYLEDAATPTLRHNCVYGNTEYDYTGLTDPTGTDGNISVDPLLAGQQFGNVHIQPGSPCVDAGSNTDALGDLDMDGEPRIHPLGGTVDIGADESDGTAWPAGPYIIVHVSSVGDDANDGSSWMLAKRMVQAGIDVAFELGGEVWVQAGTYYERITLPPYVYLYGGFAGDETGRDQRDWAANVTTLDGQQEGTVVTARGGYGAVSAVDGFTITNGNAGGFYLSSSSPTIANNTITGNRAGIREAGGGLSLMFSFPTIVNNTITGNDANHGGGLFMYRSSPTIANNTITGNDANHGGGLSLNESSPTIANTIVAFNSSGIYQDYDDAGNPTLRHNCVYGNAAYDYDGLADPTWTDGNISVDPLLASPQYGNVHIQPDSPCVDAGNNADASGVSDMDGQPRIQSGTVDIGADESDGTVWPAGPYTIVRVSPMGDDANDGSSWALAKRTVQAGIDAANVEGGRVWVQAGTYHECVTLLPDVSLYGGFAGGETEWDQRDWRANVTTLDGQQKCSVVTARVGSQVSAIDGFTITNGSAYYGGGLNVVSSTALAITNNTITDNRANSGGGGLYLNESSPTIADNTIMGNTASDAGGGLYLEYSFPLIVNSTITGNSTDSGHGGGLYLYRSYPTIVNNTITGNDAMDNGGGLYMSDCSLRVANNTIVGNTGRNGGGLYLSSSYASIANNTITGNGASGLGGGLHLYESSPTIANNTITGNGASSGGGFYLRFFSSPRIRNTIVAFNSSGICRSESYPSTPTLQYNCVYGNTEYDYEGLDDPTGTDGNISAETLFAQNPAPGPDGLWGTIDDDFGNLHLSSGSPCIDAGDNQAVPADTTDLDGDDDTAEPIPLDLDGLPRFAEDALAPNVGLTDGTWPIVDMGAYERADCDGNGVRDEEDITGGSSDDHNGNGYPDQCEPTISIVTTDPPDCAIDARQPCDPDGSNPQGWQAVELDLDNAGLYLTASDFDATEYGDGVDGMAPSIISVAYAGWHTVKVHLSEPIEPGAWTTITHRPTGETVSLGYLPADVNGDGTAAPADILWLIDCLNDVRSCEIWQCDIDRSGVCGPPDILRVIDLLNGTGVYEPWLNVSLPECPAGVSVFFDLPTEIEVGSTVDMDNDTNPDTGQPILQLTGAPTVYEVLFFASADGALPPDVLLSIDNDSGELHIDPASATGDDVEITVQVFGYAGLLAEASDTFTIVAAP